MIPRLLEVILADSLAKTPKILLLYGPRQAGKTTLLQSLRRNLEGKTRILYLNADLAEERSVIDTTSLVQLEQLLGQADLLFLDETQRLADPGLTLKIIYDHFSPRLRVLATGSSSLNLKNKVSDALTGRYLDFTLYPFSWAEVAAGREAAENKVLRQRQAQDLLPVALLYGAYPEVFLQNSPQTKQTMLAKIVESYLFKDILSFNRVRFSETLVNLARALAYQIGGEVNESELAGRLKIDRKTVANYLDLLEQTFVIVKVHPFAGNQRREVGRHYKVYFLDLGLRNALIGDFNPLEVRADAGALWENFIIAERIKKAANQNEPLVRHFWRTFGGAEVDWIEKRVDRPLQAFEFKFRAGILSRGAHSFTARYQTPVQLVNCENFLDFV